MVYHLGILFIALLLSLSIYCLAVASQNLIYIQNNCLGSQTTVMLLFYLCELPGALHIRVLLGYHQPCVSLDLVATRSHRQGQMNRECG